jgi:hypothetical protein
MPGRAELQHAEPELSGADGAGLGRPSTFVSSAVGSSYQLSLRHRVSGVSVLPHSAQHKLGVPSLETLYNRMGCTHVSAD